MALRKSVRFLAFFCIFTLLFSCVFTPAADGNDERFSTYVNMGENAVNNNYAIPNLFRQDGVYTNMKRFPLVVSGGVEYVPLSAFMLYSYVEVGYSSTNDNFFLVNNRTERYISFNVSEGVAFTYDDDLLRLKSAIFNKTRYVPARAVASILGFSCETYDDPVSGVYAFRISDGKSNKTLEQLITPYIEKNKDLINPPAPPDPELPPVMQEDPLEDIAARRIALCYGNIGYTDIATVLRVLNGYGIKASFCVSKDDIEQSGKLVRNIFVSGHNLLLTASAEGDSVEEYAKNFVDGLDNTNESLMRLLKRKTRMCVLPLDIPVEIAENPEFILAVEKAGYVILKPNTDAGDGPDSKTGAYSISGKIKNKITDGFDKTEPATVTAFLWCSDKTQYYTADVANFVKKYNQHTFFAMNEAMLYNS